MASLEDRLAGIESGIASLHQRLDVAELSVASWAQRNWYWLFAGGIALGVALGHFV